MSDEGRKLLAEFEHTIALAEARAWSAESLRRPLNVTEFEKYRAVMEKLGVTL